MARLNINVEVKGLDRLQRNLLALYPEARKAASAELYRCGQEILRESLKIVPMKTGALASTGMVTFPTEKPGEISVTIGYGGVAVNYAVYVHENLDPGVRWTRPGSGPKYLERPAMTLAPQLGARIGQAVQRAWNRLRTRRS